MTKSEHLWAIGYDDMERAEQVRDEIIRLGWNTHYLDLLDVAVVVRHPDDDELTRRVVVLPAFDPVDPLDPQSLGYRVGHALGDRPRVVET